MLFPHAAPKEMWWFAFFFAFVISCIAGGFIYFDPETHKGDRERYGASKHQERL